MERLFIRWVRNPQDPEIGKFWDGWLVKYPHMLAIVDTARNLVNSASELPVETISNEEVGSLWHRIRSSIEIFPEIQNSRMRTIAGKFYFLRWSIGIVGTVFLIILLIVFKPPGGRSPVVDRPFGELKKDSVDYLVKPDSSGVVLKTFPK